MYPAVPDALCYSDDESVIGSPFYMMERIEGIILRGQPTGDRPLEVLMGFNLVNITDVGEKEETIDFDAALLDTASPVTRAFHQADVAQELGNPDRVIFERNFVLGHFVGDLPF